MTRSCPSRDYDFWPFRIKPSPGACCTQAHVFSPADRSPYAEARGYILQDTPIATYLDRLNSPGLDRGVIVHGSAHCSDHRVSLDGIATAPDRLHGDALADPDLDEGGLAQLDAGGMRGIRLLAMLKGAVGSDRLWGFGV